MEWPAHPPLEGGGGVTRSALTTEVGHMILSGFKLLMNI